MYSLPNIVNNPKSKQQWNEDHSSANFGEKKGNHQHGCMK